jgi:hypothetical protein
MCRKTNGLTLVRRISEWFLKPREVAIGRATVICNMLLEKSDKSAGNIPGSTEDV